MQCQFKDYLSKVEKKTKNDLLCIIVKYTHKYIYLYIIYIIYLSTDTHAKNAAATIICSSCYKLILQLGIL